MGWRMVSWVRLSVDACENPGIENPGYRKGVLAGCAADGDDARGRGCGAAVSGDGVRYVERASAERGARDGADAGTDDQNMVLYEGLI